MNIRNGKDWALLLIRVVLGFTMIYGHGWRKMIKLFTERPIEFGNPIGLGPELSLGLAVFAEVLCSVLLILGLFTRSAVIPLIITMAVAAFVVHIDDGFGRMEKAILYLVPYIALLLMGAGEYSLDAKVRNKA